MKWFNPYIEKGRLLWFQIVSDHISFPDSNDLSTYYFCILFITLFGHRPNMWSLFTSPLPKKSLYSSLHSLEVFGVLSERSLGPLWLKMQTTSIVLGLPVKSGVLVTGNHLRLFWEIEFEIVDLFESCQLLAFFLEWLVQDFNVSVHKLHSLSQPVFLRRGKTWGLLPKVPSICG